jgi:hypothetical protein
VKSSFAAVLPCGDLVVTRCAIVNRHKARVAGVIAVISTQLAGTDGEKQVHIRNDLRDFPRISMSRSQVTSTS